MTKRLEAKDLIIYALPAAPLAALSLPLYIIVPTFYSETLGLSLSAVGVALLLVRVVDAVLDPALGWLSDRWRPAYGRRRSFFAIGLPIAALSVFMLFWPPPSAGAGYLFGWGTLLSVSFTALTLAYTAWGAEMAGGYAERSRIAGYRETFTIIGTLIAITIPFAVGMNAHQFNGLAVLGVAVAVGLLAAGGFAILRLPEPVDHTVARVSLFAGLRHMGRNAAFVRLIVAYLINGLANAVPATLFLYFVSARLEAPEVRGPLLFIYFLAGLAGVPLTIWLAARLGKHRAWCYAMLANCLVFSLAMLLGPGDVAAFAVISAFTGLCLGFDLSLPAAIQADVIDADTAVSGEQRSGLYFAAWSLATKLSLALSAGIIFPLLAAFGFAASEGARNAPSSIAALVGLYVWAPIGLKLIAVGLMWRFPLDEREQLALRKRIEQRG